eukprot:357591-Chlamydomonas_euryale.AAC.3
MAWLQVCAKQVRLLLESGREGKGKGGRKGYRRYQAPVLNTELVAYLVWGGSTYASNAAHLVCEAVQTRSVWHVKSSTSSESVGPLRE